MKKCQHEKHEATVNVYRLQEESEFEPHAYIAEVHIRCAICGQKFYFKGIPCGIFENRPSVSPDGEEARLPMTMKPLIEITKEEQRKNRQHFDCGNAAELMKSISSLT